MNKLTILLRIWGALNGKKTDIGQVIITIGLVLGFFGMTEEQKQLEQMAPQLTEAIVFIVVGLVPFVVGVTHKIIKIVRVASTKSE
ncbi:MAG: hypothetical protein SCH71_17480 [Desulfobulbaceae bacterium]|nr:hypothetical protein [Desulfobulbaceae bacterium]